MEMANLGLKWLNLLKTLVLLFKIGTEFTP
mgnify:CR=1 FL=1